MIANGPQAQCPPCPLDVPLKSARMSPLKTVDYHGQMRYDRPQTEKPGKTRKGHKGAWHAWSQKP